METLTREEGGAHVWAVVAPLAPSVRMAHDRDGWSQVDDPFGDFIDVLGRNEELGLAHTPRAAALRASGAGSIPTLLPVAAHVQFGVVAGAVDVLRVGLDGVGPPVSAGNA